MHAKKNNLQDQNVESVRDYDSWHVLQKLIKTVAGSDIINYGKSCASEDKIYLQ